MNSVLVNNLVHHWRGIGIMLAGTDNTLVANNTAYANGTDGTWSGLSLVSKNNPADFANTRVRVVNNVLNRMSVANGSERPELEEFNLVREGGAGIGLLTSAPQFVDEVSMKLRATSPAVNTGTSRYAPDNDINGLVRDPLVDRGASEHGAVAPSPAPGPAMVTEGEAMSLPLGGAVRSDPTASGGSVLEQYSVSTSTAGISLAAPATRLVVRARASQCSGAPRMIVMVDGAAVLDTLVTGTSWADYRAAVTLPAGWHVLSVRFPNDYRPMDCDRNLYLDKLTFVQ